MASTLACVQAMVSGSLTRKRCKLIPPHHGATALPHFSSSDKTHRNSWSWDTSGEIDIAPIWEYNYFNRSCLHPDIICVNAYHIRLTASSTGNPCRQTAFQSRRTRTLWFFRIRWSAYWFECWFAAKSQRIPGADWVSSSIAIDIGIAAAELKRIFGEEATNLRVIIPCSVVVIPGRVVLPPGILVAVGAGRAARRRVAGRVIAVARLHRSGRVRERNARPEPIGEIGRGPGACRPREAFVDALLLSGNA